MHDIFSKDTPLVLVGCGNMGGAMAEGWLAAGLSVDALIIADPTVSEGRIEGVPASNYLDSVTDLAEGTLPRAVVLAVKPQIIDKVLPALTSLVSGDTLVISVAAGVTLEQMQRGIGTDAVYVRTMPNTPAAVGAGITGLTADAGISPENRALACELLASTGATVWIADEALMDAVTGVSGSGPAYIFHMVESMAAAGAAQGLPADVAMQLARQTVIGAARLMEAQPEVPADELRRRVTSPNGTTAAALDVLMGDEGQKPLMSKAVAAATKRGKELAG